MKTQIIFCLLIITLASFSIHAQTRVDPAWVKHFGSCQPPENNAAGALEVNRFGNVYVTGYKGDSLEASRVYATIKYDTDGIEQWVKFYNGSVNARDEATDLVVDAARNVYITGISEGGFVTLKYNTYGMNQWITKSLYFSHYRLPHLKLDKGSNVYMTCVGKGTPELWILLYKYDLNGNEKWRKYYSRSFSDISPPPVLAVNISGDVYLAYGSSSFSNYTDFSISKYNEFGFFQGTGAVYNGPGNYHDYPVDISVDDSSNIFITGVSSGIGTGYDYVVIKYDSNLQQQWIARYNNEPGNPDDYAIAIKVDSSENFYVTGRSWGG